MSERFLRLGEVRKVTGLSKTELYRRISAGLFPRQHRLSHRVSVWIESEVAAWVQHQIAASLTQAHSRDRGPACGSDFEH